MLSAKESQLLHRKAIKCRSLIYLSKLFGRGMLSVLVWTVMVTNANENHVAFLFFFGSRGEILRDRGTVGIFPKVMTAIVCHRRFMVGQDG